jgi:hypothetical protein
MFFTFPIYVTVKALTREEARTKVDLIFKQYNLTANPKISYTISQSINSPDLPSWPKPKLPGE